MRLLVLRCAVVPHLSFSIRTSPDSVRSEPRGANACLTAHVVGFACRRRACAQWADWSVMSSANGGEHYLDAEKAALAKDKAAAPSGIRMDGGAKM